MKLSEFLLQMSYLKCTNDKDIEIERISINSKKLQKNSIFICLNGKNVDGHNYVQEAIKNGAVAIVCEKILKVDLSIPQILVSDTRIAYAEISEIFFKHPSNKLKVIGVVGTNGKSTTSYLIYEILKRSGKKVGLIGSMYYEYMNHKEKSNMTTPDPYELNRLFLDMVVDGVEYVVMEVSAHAIYLKKVYGIKFEVKVFTNFSQDHLDYFKDMNSYRECKKSFFIDSNESLLIINSDDDLGLEIINSVNNRVISYGIDKPSDIFAINIKNSIKGTSYVMNLFDDILFIKSNLIGKFNVLNEMAAAICCRSIGLHNEIIVNSIGLINPPEGRFNVFRYKGITYVVDFAHTPDGLSNLLNEVKNIAKGNVITVFGCGGDRDCLKRPIMGKIASEFSDVIIVTSDNPRTEDKMEIIVQIIQGIKSGCKFYVESDRKKAIELSLEIAKKGDFVVLAGKGAENYMEINNEKIPYSDIEEVKKFAK